MHHTVFSDGAQAHQPGCAVTTRTATITGAPGGTCRSPRSTTYYEGWVCDRPSPRRAPAAHAALTTPTIPVDLHTRLAARGERAPRCLLAWIAAGRRALEAAGRAEFNVALDRACGAAELTPAWMGGAP